MRRVLWFALAVAFIGAALIGYAIQLPVYTVPNAPNLVTEEAEDVPEEERTEFWFRRMSELETPHKRLFDLGQGLLAAGGGVSLLYALAVGYNRFSFSRSWYIILFLWCGAWMIQLPGTIYFYTYRQKRHDYPWWEDSIAIPIFSQGIASVVGGFASLCILGLLIGKSRLPKRLVMRSPPYRAHPFSSWVLFLWGCLLILIIVTTIPSGDLGMIVSCILGILPLGVTLAAKGEPDVQ